MKESLLSLRCGWFLPSARLGSIGKRHLNLIAAFLLTLPLFGQAEPLRILVAGDGRADYPDPNDPNHLPSPRFEDKNGFNEVINTEIRDAVRKEKANIFLWTGDISNVLTDDAETLQRQLKAWRDIMEPLYGDAVKVLPTRGNHEFFWHDRNFNEQNISGATKIWTSVFSGRYALPTNDAQELSFYYVREPVLLIGLDTYESQEKHSINQDWLDKVLEQNKQRFIFAYCHEPAFAAGGSHGSNDTLALWPDKRDGMWRTLYRAGARVYFCGHDHFYDHMIAKSQDGCCEMHQLTAGTAGAPFNCHGPYPPEKSGT
jgi:Predicted phosphohydrolases